MKTLSSSIAPPDRLRICVEAGVHPDSLRRYLRALPVRILTARRIEAAARRLGLELAPPSTPPPYEPGAERHKDGPWGKDHFCLFSGRRGRVVAET